MNRNRKKMSLFLLAGILILSGSIRADVFPKNEMISVSQQTGKVTGLVEDVLGPIAGASVVVKGTTNGTMTDMDGKFVLENVKKGDKIQISFVGYLTQEVVYNGSSIKVRLTEDSQQIDEVVVTALGIKRESKALGYAMTTIKADELIKTGTPNFATSLYGKASGVRIQAAPGGSSAAVSINVRGLSSITGSNQPLVIVNGVPVRNGDANNDGYWGDQRIRSNGLVDINPEDIESLSILKGASASALYGSEAANGVVLITTKSGKGKQGIGVDFNANLSADFVAYMPEYQTVYGPGVRNGSRGEYEQTTGGFYEREYLGKTYKSIRSSNAYFGPKYDGSDILYYDGTIRKYEPISSKPWSDVFRTGFNQTYNLAITQGNEKGNMRFSYTFVDNLPNQYNSTYNKHNFSLTGAYSLNEKLQFNYSVNYILQSIKNRPYRISRLTNNFGGMFGAWDDIKWIRDHTVTSLGYMNTTVTDKTPTPDEAFAYWPGCSALVNEYYWNIYGKEERERDNRLIASVTPSWSIIDGLRLQGRIATDYSVRNTESKYNTEKPLAYGSPTGAYILANNRYDIYYGDVMLIFNKNVTEKLNITANAGWQGRIEKAYNVSTSTNGGLSVENWFHLNASKNKANVSMYKSEFLKTAFFGTLSLGWDSYAYIEGTVRQEKTSTLASGNNSFFYPSANASFIYTEAFKDHLPAWYDYGKVRVSYGIVGNAPAVYAANVAYQQASTSGYISNYISGNLGNKNINPEEKHEFEIGLENKFLNNRLGFEVSYYHNVIKDQILSTTMPQSSGGTSILMNIGELQNSGVELSLYGTPVQTKDWTWTLNGNISFNKNTVNKLMEGVNVLQHMDIDGGAVTIESHVGEAMGDIYAFDIQRDANGNEIIGKDGFGILTDKRVKVGNAMPKATGGINSSLRYKNFFLDATIDFRIGGDVVNVPYEYMMGRGALKETMKYRDAEHGGMTYYYKDNDHAAGVVVPYTGGAKGPGGEIVYDNGMILPGVKEDGTANDIMIPSDKWYNWTYNWGTGSPTYYGHSVFDNTYVKLRELTLGYTLPKELTSKFACQHLTISLYGRNLFYFYKNLPIFDAEATDGTSWVFQSQIGGSTATTRSFGFSLRASF